MAAQTPPTFPFTGSTINATRSNTVALKTQGFHEEYASSDSGSIYPTMLLDLQTDGTVKRHASAGGRSEALFAKEDANQGHWFQDAMASGDWVSCVRAEPGDHILACLGASCTAVVEGDYLVSAGDGTLQGIGTQTTHTLYEATAASSAISNTTAATTFSNGSYTIPANFLQAGDIITIEGEGIVTAVNSTNTLAVAVKIGSTVLLSIPATNYTANDVFRFRISMVIRTIGASGTFVADITYNFGTPGTATDFTALKASTTIDTTATEAVTVVGTWSVANSGNSCRLDVLDIGIARTNPQSIAARALESVDNSANASSMAYIRVRVM